MTATIARREARGTMPLETRLAPLGSIDAKARTARCVFSTGARVRRYDWAADRFYQEELVVTPQAVRLDRLRAGAPLLNAHSQGDIRDVVGVVESPQIVDGHGEATLRFSQRAEVAPIWQDVQDRVLPNVSVGYRRHRIERVPPTRDGDDWIYRVVDWEPFEISLVPIGADPGAQIRGDGKCGKPRPPTDPRSFDCVFIDIERTANMDNEPTSQASTGTAGSGAADDARLERRRVADIVRITAPQAAQRVLRPGELQRFIEDGTSPESVSMIVLRRLGDLSDATATRSAAHLPEWGAAFVSENSPAASTEGLRKLWAEVVCERTGGPKASDAARALMRKSAKEVMRAFEALRGVNADLLTEGELYSRNAHSTSDFIVGGTIGLNTSLTAQFNTIAPALMRCARRSTVADFRPKTAVKMGTFPALQKVLEGGVVKMGTVADGKESYSAATYSIIFEIARQLLINDYLDGLGQSVRTGALSAANTAGELMVSTLRGAGGLGPAMDDTKTLFHADHGNIGTGGAISFTTLSEGRKMMRLQRHLDGKTVIDAAPSFLIVPAALESKAEQELANVAAVQTANVNPFSNLQLLTEPRLDDYSATRWYLASEPSRCPGLEYSYLDGFEGPRLEVEEGFDFHGTRWRLTMDFGTGFVEHRGWFTNAGA